MGNRCRCDVQGWEVEAPLRERLMARMCDVIGWSTSGTAIIGAHDRRWPRPGSQGVAQAFCSLPPSSRLVSRAGR